MTATHVPASRCECGYVADLASPLSPSDTTAAAPGCLTICIRCGRLNEFTEDMQLRPFDIEKLSAAQRRQVQRFQALLAEDAAAAGKA